MDVIIYHNPDYGTSRNTLGLIRDAGIEPHIMEYLNTPETVLDILPVPQQGPFSKENGELVSDEQDRRVSAA